jgi:hypothetical protein
MGETSGKEPFPPEEAKKACLSGKEVILTRDVDLGPVLCIPKASIVGNHDISDNLVTLPYNPSDRKAVFDALPVLAKKSFTSEEFVRNIEEFITKLLSEK